MEKSIVIEKIREVFPELSTPVNVNEIKNSDSLQDDHGIDSLLIMEFMVLLEEKFEFEFEDDFDVDTLYSIDTIASYIAGKH
ncbi:phosphopantetheine-binding protein [Paenibacillus xylanexedens]|uniref:phosphopantetheine-binding protein n=1 Tax=Paenibacillus sp. FSL R7-0272 TaxID=2921679 RepID=UPI0012B7FC95|nr:phosphopantetheine-binding protein [Paenibacillus xylanexedens]